MRIPAPGQVLLIPMSLLVSAVVSLPAWNHFTVDEESPIYSTKEAADRWGRAEIQTQKCLASTVDFQSISENLNSAGPWFGKLRCNQHRIYLRVILILLLPYLAINFVAALLVNKVQLPKKP